MDTPNWILEVVHMARELYGVDGSEWYCEVRMTDTPGEDSTLIGHTTSQPFNHNLLLEFSSILENTEKGWATVFHEVLHAAMSAVDYVGEMAITHTLKSKQEILLDDLTREKEAFVSTLSRRAAKLYWKRFGKEVKS